jgi:E3 ubiquitin-protein ligase HUWE1
MFLLLLSQPYLPAVDTNVYSQSTDTESQGPPDSEEPGPWERVVAEPSSSKSVTNETAEDRRREPDTARESLISSMPRQAIHLLDEHSSLMFDVHRVFTATGEAAQESSINLLIGDIKSFSPAAYDIQEQPSAVQCRLLAITLADALSERWLSKTRMDDLLALLLSDSMQDENSTPKWPAVHSSWNHC